MVLAKDGGRSIVSGRSDRSTALELL